MATKKIVVIGPESTGKSTLTEDLAIALHCNWLPEYAREYLEDLKRPYSEADLLIIAQNQVLIEKAALQKNENYLICDTDLHVIKVWSEHKYGSCAPWILSELTTQKCDLYLLTDIDIPWEFDPLREHEALEMRAYFYNIYLSIVSESNIPWIAINGSREQRLAQAINAVKSLR